jgi:hypothetical protein
VQKEMEGEVPKKRKGGENVEFGAQMAKKKK